jgi:hypothetical protein
MDGWCAPLHARNHALTHLPRFLFSLQPEGHFAPRPVFGAAEDGLNVGHELVLVPHDVSRATPAQIQAVPQH